MPATFSIDQSNGIRRVKKASRVDWRMDSYRV